ncbi:hypothetical protein [Aeromicrobium wangtongii]|uniref:Bacteriocin biosynthesis cyclodehydratase domain-containing protein n=1 Tax=Aeromicrobium wangtongii TaxID=2969247 RepID=A0ABY5M7H9_9ACTN|nr:hypothetical protein [Aeromicrobium wangtongii]MCD9199044.1 hypothetical protein [Aeromicrobium wangtongii]UUP12925.1 hypothetical protein NQV15_13820 [Aeromicrobium wangtongii]
MSYRPALRPGAPLLRRDATHLQIGTSPGIVVADRPGLLPLLRLLDGVRDIDRLEAIVRVTVPELEGTAAAALAELRAAGAVVDAGGGAGRHRARARRRVGFEIAPGTDDVAAAARSILAAAGVAQLASPEPELLVIASFGEPARSVYERPALLGIDHLPVVVDEDRVRLGPLVRPGRTPCVGCHDRYRTDWDPAWPVLLHQLGRRPPLPRVTALDPLTSHAAAIEIAAEVLAHLDGQVPRTTGHCLYIGPRHDERTSRLVAFHPRCACDLLSAA